MKVAVPTLAPVLRSDTQGRLLATIFTNPDAERTITELASLGVTSVPTAIREIDRAEAAQIVTSRRLGNTRLVKANPTNPLYQPYRDIILATYGPPAIIGEEFGTVRRIEYLYLYGSWAARYQGEPGRMPNDIDVLVVGTPDRDRIDGAAERSEKRIGMPVQAVIRTPAQWANRKDSFVTEVRSRPLVSLNDHPQPR
jgi:hypothetical protein